MSVSQSIEQAGSWSYVIRKYLHLYRRDFSSHYMGDMDMLRACKLVKHIILLLPFSNLVHQPLMGKSFANDLIKSQTFS